MDGWMDGWVDGWMDGAVGLRIAYSNQKEANISLSLSFFLSILHLSFNAIARKLCKLQIPSHNCDRLKNCHLLKLVKSINFQVD